MQEFDLNMTDYDGRAPLHLAAAEGHLDAVKYVSHICHYFPTFNNFFKYPRFLLEVAEVNPDPQDRLGDLEPERTLSPALNFPLFFSLFFRWRQTPLSEAVRFKHIKVARCETFMLCDKKPATNQ